MKTCTGCGEPKPLEAFKSNGVSKFTGEQYRRSECRSCTSKIRKAERQADPEVERARSRAQHAKFREARNAKRRAYRVENSEAEKHRLRYATDPEYRDRKVRAANRTRLYDLTTTHSTRDWQSTLKRFGGKCAYCDAPAEHKDHVVPLARGGSDAIGNLLPACRKCNQSKGSKLLIEWRPHRG